MIVYWGKLAGLALGIFGGPIGVIFAVLVGHLLDLVAAEYLLRRAIARMAVQASGRFPRTFSVASALLGLAAAGVATTTWRPAPEDREAFIQASARLDPVRWRLFERGRGRYLDAAIAARRAIELPDLARQIAELLQPDDRAQLIEHCRITLDVELRGRALERLRELARSVELSEEWIESKLPRAGSSGAQGPLDRDVCRILGVEPDTDAAEVRRVYRKLAAQFHPDTAAGLSDDQREQSAAAFVTIREAYDRAVHQLGEE